MMKRQNFNNSNFYYLLIRLFLFCVLLLMFHGAKSQSSPASYRTILTNSQLNNGEAKHGIQDKIGNFYISAGNGGYVKLDTQGNIETIIQNLNLASVGYVYSSYRDNDTLYIAAGRVGVFRYVIGEIPLDPLDPLDQYSDFFPIDNAIAYQCFKNQKGALIVSAGQKGLFLVRNDGSIDTILRSTQINNGSVFHCFQDAIGNYIVSAGTGGVIKIDTFGNFSTILTRSQLNNGSANYGLQDADGNYFISAEAGGVIKYSIDGVASTYVSALQLNNASVNTIFLDANNNLVITNSADLKSFSTSGNLTTLITNSQLNNGSPQHTFLDKNGDLVISVGAQGVVLLNNYFVKVDAKVKFGTISSGSGIKGSNVRITYQPNPGYMLDSIIVNNNYGANYLDSANGYTLRNLPDDSAITVIYKPDFSNGNNYRTAVSLIQTNNGVIYNSFEDRQKNIVISSSKGIFAITSDGFFQNWSTIFSYNFDTVFHVTQDAQNNYYISAGRKGLLKLSSNGVVQTLLNAMNLKNAKVLSTFLGNNNYLYLCLEDSGVLKFNVLNSQSEIFLSATDLQKGKALQGFENDNGTVFISSDSAGLITKSAQGVLTRFRGTSFGLGRVKYIVKNNNNDVYVFADTSGVFKMDTLNRIVKIINRNQLNFGNALQGYIDNNNNLFISADTSGVFGLLSNGNFVNLVYRTQITNGRALNCLKYFNGKFYVSYQNAGLIELDPYYIIRSQSNFGYVGAANGFARSSVSVSFQPNIGFGVDSILINGTLRSISLISPYQFNMLQGDSQMNIINKPLTSTNVRYLISALQNVNIDVNHSFEDMNGDYIVSGGAAGVFKLNKQGYIQNIVKPIDINYGIVYSCINDSTGNLIINAGSAGVFKQDKLTQQITVLLTPSQINSGKAYYSFYDSSKLLVVCAGKGGLIRILSNGIVQTTISNAQVSNNEIVRAFVTSQGVYIISAQLAGVLKFENNLLSTLVASSSIKNDSVYNCTQAPDNNIIISAGTSGVYIYDNNLSSVQQVISSNQANGSVVDAFREANGNLIFSVLNKGLYLNTPSNNLITLIESTLLQGGNANSIYKNKNGVLLLNNGNKGLITLDTPYFVTITASVKNGYINPVSGKSYSNIEIKFITYPGFVLDSILINGKPASFASPYDSTYIFKNIKSDSSIMVIFKPDSTIYFRTIVPNRNFNYGSINHSFQDNTNNTYLSTTTGLYKLNGSSGVLSTVIAAAQVGMNPINHAFIDEDGLLIASVQNIGIVKVLADQTLDTIVPIGNLFNGNPLYVKRYFSNLLVAADNGGIVLVSGIHPAATTQLFSKEGLNNGNVKHFLIDALNRIIVAADSAGVFLITNFSSLLQYISPANLRQGQAKYLNYDADGNLYVSAGSAGLVKYSKYNIISNDISSSLIGNDILIQSAIRNDGSLILYTNRGVYFVSKNDKVSNFISNSQVPNIKINGGNISSSQYIYVNTMANGLILIDPYYLINATTSYGTNKNTGGFLGQNIPFVYKENYGYVLDSVLINNRTQNYLDSTNRYTFKNLRSDSIIRVKYKPNITLFSRNPFTNTQFNNQKINYFFINKYGSKIICTNQGVYEATSQGNVIQLLKAADLNYFPALHAFQDFDDDLIISCGLGGVLILKSDRSIIYVNSTYNFGFVNQCLPKNNSTFWVLSASLGVLEYNKTQINYSISVSNAVLGNKKVNSIFRDPLENLYICVQDSHLFKKSVSGQFYTYISENSLNLASPLTGFLDKDKNMVILTKDSGVFIVIDSQVTQLVTPSSLANSLLSSGFVDTSNNIILCSPNSGVFVFSQTQKALTHLYRPFKNGVIDTIVCGGVEFNKNLLIASRDSGIVQFDFPFNLIINGSAKYGYISTVSGSRGQDLRINYQPNIGYILDSVIVNNRRIKNYRDSISGYTFRNVRGDSSILVVYKVDPNYDYRVLVSSKQVGNDTIFYSFKDNSNNLIVCASSQGVYKLSPNGFLTPLLTRQQINYGSARFGFIDTNNNIYIFAGTGGLIRINANGSISQLVTRSQINNFQVLQGVLHDSNKIYFVTGNGGMWLVKQDNSITNVLTQTNFRNGRAVWITKDRNNNLIISASNGGVSGRGGVFEYTKNNVFSTLLTGLNLTNRSAVYAFRDIDSSIIVSILGNTPNTSIVSKYNPILSTLAPFFNEAQLNYGNIFQCYKDNDGNFISSAGTGGVVFYSKLGVLTNLLQNNQLSNGAAMSVLKEQSGNFIVNAGTGGIIQTDPFLFVNTSSRYGIISSGGGLKGSNIKITYTPNPGYVLDSVIVNNNRLVNYRDSVSSYTFNNISNDNSLLVKFKPDTQVQIRVPLTSGQLPNSGQVLHSFIDSNKNIIASAGNSGVIRLSQDGEATVLLNQTQLNNGFASYSFLDNMGNLIVCARTGGVIKYAPDQSVSTLIPANRLNGGSALQGFQDTAGNYYISADNGGVVVLLKGASTATTLLTVNQLNGGRALHCFKDSDQNLIVSAYNGGVILVNKFGVRSTLLTQAQLNGNGGSYHSFKDNQGNLIISAEYGGVLQFSKDSVISTLVSYIDGSNGKFYHSFKDSSNNLIVSYEYAGVLQRSINGRIATPLNHNQLNGGYGAYSSFTYNNQLYVSAGSGGIILAEPFYFINTNVRYGIISDSNGYKGSNIKISYKNNPGYILDSVIINNNRAQNYKDSLTSFTFRSITKDNAILTIYKADTFQKIRTPVAVQQLVKDNILNKATYSFIDSFRNQIIVCANKNVYALSSNGELNSILNPTLLNNGNANYGFIDSLGDIYIFAGYGGVILYSKRGEVRTLITSATIGGAEANYGFKDKDGNLIVCASSNGVYKYYLSTSEISQIVNAFQLNAGRVNHAFLDSTNNLIISAGIGGVVQLSNKGLVSTLVSPTVITDLNVLSCFKDTKGNLVLSTENTGVLQFTKSGNLTELVSASTLNNHAARYAFYDKQDNLYVCADSNGLGILFKNSTYFNILSPNLLQIFPVNYAFTDRNNFLYVVNGNLVQVEPIYNVTTTAYYGTIANAGNIRGNKVTLNYSPNLGYVLDSVILNNNIQTNYLDSQNRFIISNINTNYNLRVVFKQDSLFNIRTVGTSAQFNYSKVNHSFTDKYNNKIISTSDGVYVVNNRGFRYNLLNKFDINLGEATYSFKDNDDNLYIFAQNGGIIKNFVDGSVQTIANKLQLNNGKALKGILLNSGNLIVAADSGGLVKINPQGAISTLLTRAQLNGNIVDISTDPFDNLVITSLSGGIFYYNTQTQNLQNIINTSRLNTQFKQAQLLNDIYLITTSSGIYELNALNVLKQIVSPNQISNSNINYVYKYPSGKTIISTSNFGLYILDSNYILQNVVKGNQLNNGFVNHAYFDSSNKIIISADIGGLIEADPYYFIKSSINYGIASTGNGFIKSKQPIYYYPNFGYRFNNAMVNNKNYFDSTERYTFNNLRSDSAISILNRYDSATYYRLATSSAQVPQGNFIQFFKDNLQQHYLILTTKGLFKLDNNGYLSPIITNQVIPTDNFNFGFAKNDGSVIICNQKSGVIQVFLDGSYTTLLNAQNLNGGSALNGFEDANGNLIIVADSGGVIRRYSNGTLETILTRVELGNQPVKHAFYKNDGSLIVSTANAGVLSILNNQIDTVLRPSIINNSQVNHTFIDVNNFFIC